MKRQIFPVSVALALATFPALANGAAITQYTVTDLGLVGTGLGSFGIAINNNGVVVGQTVTSANRAIASVSRSGGRYVTLGVSGDENTSAVAVNDAGIAACTGPGNGGTLVASTVNISNSAQTVLPTFGGPTTMAGGISASGLVVGASSYGSTDSVVLRAFFYTPGSLTLTPLDTANTTGLGGTGDEANSVANGVSASKAIVGEATTALGTNHAFVYSGSAMYDLGTIDSSDGAQSDAFAINDAGVIVGSSDSTVNKLAVVKAFSYSGYSTQNATPGSKLAGTFTDLGTLGGDSEALGINAIGQIVGDSILNDADSDDHAFLYNPGTGIVDLNNRISPTSGWILERATGINTSGQITGNGVINGQSHAFLLTPITVPEPTTAVLFAATLCLGGRRRRNSTPPRAL